MNKSWLAIAAVALLGLGACNSGSDTATRTVVTPLTGEAATVQQPAPAQTQPEPQPVEKTRQICQHCGQVTAVTRVVDKEKVSGTGAVIGAIVGGVAGHQLGGDDTGRAVGTVAGAIAGGYVGNRIEKDKKTKDHYRITVRMENGKTYHFNREHRTGYAVGTPVYVRDGVLSQR